MSSGPPRSSEIRSRHPYVCIEPVRLRAGSAAASSRIRGAGRIAGGNTQRCALLSHRHRRQGKRLRARSIARAWAIPGVPVKFSVLPSSLDSIYAVTHNNMHLAAAGLVRNERRQVIWSAPIREVEYVLVGRNLSRQLSSEKELANRRIGVRRGSVPAEALDAIRNRIPSMRLTYPISGGEAELLERVARAKSTLLRPTGSITTWRRTFTPSYRSRCH